MKDNENIYSLKGIEKVFLFTLRQTFKNKGYLASFVIFVLVITFMGPLQYAMREAGNNAADSAMSGGHHKSKVESVYINDQTGVLGESDLGLESGSVSYVPDESTISDNLGAKDVGIVIKPSETGFMISGIMAEKSKISEDELEDITSDVRNAFNDKRYEVSGISKDEVNMIYAGVSVDDVLTESDQIKEEESQIRGENYGLYMLGFAMVVFIVISMSTSYIITSVTEEKQSKLVETLLVSVRPMALLLGKVTGMMGYVIMVLICGAVGSTISSFVMKESFGIDKAEYGGSGYDFSIFTSFGIGNSVLLVLSILFAFLLFGMVSGLFGSACNKTEDIQNATGNVMTFTMLGYFTAMVVGFVDNDIATLLTALIPPFSFFTAPVAFIAGRISGGILAVSYVIQLAAIILVMRFSAKVYRVLLLSDSTTPKFKTIFNSLKGA